MTMRLTSLRQANDIMKLSAQINKAIKRLIVISLLKDTYKRTTWTRRFPYFQTI